MYLLVLKLKNILLIDSHFTIFDILLSLSAIFKLYHDWFNWEGSSRHLLNSKTMTFGRCILSIKLEVGIRTCTYIYSLTWLQLHFSCNSRAYFRLRSIPVTLPHLKSHHTKMMICQLTTFNPTRFPLLIIMGYLAWCQCNSWAYFMQCPHWIRLWDLSHCKPMLYELS